MISRYSLDITKKDLLLALKDILAIKKASIHNELNEIQFTYNGRSALNILLKDYGVKRNDIVVTPLVTCESVHQAILDAGGIPKYVYSKENIYFPSPSDYANKINSENAKYVILVSSWGYPYPIDNLKKIIPRDTIIIQDCALSFGSLRAGLDDGLKADASIYSFSNGKPLFMFGGGSFKKKKKSIGNTEITLFDKNIENILNVIKLYFKSLIINNPILLKIFYSYEKKKNIDIKFNFSKQTLPWLPTLFKKNKSKVISKINERKIKYCFMVSLFDYKKIQTFNIEDDVDWNYWMVPIHIVKNIETDYVCEKMNLLGYDVIEPYKAEIENFKKNNIKSAKLNLPKIILSPSLNLMTKKTIKNFVYQLQKLL